MVNSGSKRWQKIGGEDTTLFYRVNIVFFNTESLEEISGTRNRHLFDVMNKKMFMGMDLLQV